MAPCSRIGAQIRYHHVRTPQCFREAGDSGDLRAKAHGETSPHWRSRGTGLETVKAALAAGHSMRALPRSAASIPIQNPSFKKVPGNSLDSDTIRHSTSRYHILTAAKD